MKTHNDTLIGVSGTSLVGYIAVDYDTLVSKFGEPMLGSGSGKTQAEWHVLFSDSTRCTIYDWKSHLEPREQTHWNVGGDSSHCIDLLNSVLKL